MSLNKEKVSTAVTALFTVASKLGENRLIDEVDAIQLQICLTKVPPKEKSIKLKLPHGLKHEKSDVCLFVKDLDGGKDREYEATKTHFEDLLSQHNVTCVQEIVPLKSLKLEYKPYEAKRNLSNAYDVFLADARIIRLLPSFLGKHFYGRNKVPVQVNLQCKQLSQEIDSALNNSKCVFSNKGSSSLAVVGHMEMSELGVVDNVMAAVSHIAESVPGGWQNIKQLALKTRSSPSIPVYMSSVAPQDVTIARDDDGKSEEIEAEEISTVFGAKVKVYPNGVVKVIKDGEEEVPRKKPRLTRRKKDKAGKTKTKKEKKKTTPGEKTTKDSPVSETNKTDSDSKSQFKKPVSQVVKSKDKKISAAKSGKKSAVKTPVRASKRKLTT